MARPYYSRISRSWHQATGSEGGPLKKYVLNDLILSHIGNIDGTSILEIGAGNGYFARLLQRRRSGQQLRRLVVTDVSGSLLRLAQQTFPVASAEYRQMDARRPYPFEPGTFDLVIATMVLNEIRDSDLAAALSECARVLLDGGRLLASVTHPDFVTSLERQGKIKEPSPGFFTMPGKGSMRLPVVPRTTDEYARAFSRAGFDVRQESVHPTERIVNERPGLRHSAGVPLALVFLCTKRRAT
jgi:SAM-dependent methyltransferase